MDLSGHKLMSRLVQGDVGSGKTVIAFLSMVLSAENGFQSALMVPTEVLANQHYEGFLKLMEEQGLSFPTILLVSRKPMDGPMTANSACSMPGM